MYVYVDRLFLLFCVLFTVFLCAALLVLADFLAWLARYRVLGEILPPSCVHRSCLPASM